MMSPDQIKKGLECCKCGISYGETCAKGCPYRGLIAHGERCEMMLIKDALAYIQQLQTQNDTIRESFHRLKNVVVEQGQTITQLESQVPKWIPVTERLPEDYHDVLVAMGEIVDVGFHHHRYGWECSTYKRRNNVTHWMPLPSAPEDVHAYKLVHRDPVPDAAIIVEEVSK